MYRACVTDVLSKSRVIKKVRLQHMEISHTCYVCQHVLPNDPFIRHSIGTYVSARKDCNRYVVAQRRRARLAKPGEGYSLAERETLLATFVRCLRCERRWVEITWSPSPTSVVTVDQFVQISKGSVNSLHPLCYSCNSQERDKLE